MEIPTYPTKTTTVVTSSTIRDDVAELARKNIPLPSTYGLSAKMLYYTLRGIYKAYSSKEMTVEEAKKAKGDALRDYDSMAFSEEIYHEHARRISEILKVLDRSEKCGCEYCKEVARLFDGRQWRAKL